MYRLYRPLISLACVSIAGLAIATQEWPKTPPADRPVAEGATLKIAVIGDNRPHASTVPVSEVYVSLLKQMDAMKPDLVINTGDIIYGGDRTWDRQLRDFIRATSILNAPMYVAYGNHELQNEVQYRKLNEQIGPGHYAFNVGTTRVYILNSYDPEMTGVVSGKQRDWLEKDLSTQGRKARVRIVCFHAPLFSARYEKKEIPGPGVMAARETLHEMLVKYGVNLVLAGHDHGFRWEKRDGIDYITTGGGGAPLQDIPLLQKFHHFVWMEIKDGRISVRPVALEDGATPSVTPAAP